MKKIMAAVAALIMCMTAGLSCAEETQTEKDHDFLGWLEDGLNMLTDYAEEAWDAAGPAVEAGWEKAQEAMGAGFETVMEKLTEWVESAESYMAEHGWDRKIEEAWETLKEGAKKTGAVTQEKLEAAYQTVRDWLIQTGDDVDESVGEAVDSLASAAGVAEARLAEWYRTMEDCMEANREKVTAEVQEAWNTVLENTEEAGAVTREKLDSAYATLRAWLEELGEETDPENVQVLEDMMDE